MNSTTPEVLQQIDARFHLHPFTDHNELHAVGTHILERGEGVFLYDAKGRKLLDESGLALTTASSLDDAAAKVCAAVKEAKAKSGKGKTGSERR